jgi:predicted AAA+ superfamily ATPase
VGKTTLVRQVLGEWADRAHYASADEPALKDGAWIELQWEAARRLVREANRSSAVLALDEIQKIPRWSETVKRLWDEDSAARLPLRVVLLGSAPLLVQQGLSESLAGRFELLPIPHWSFAEMCEAFGFTLEQYLWFGGYPGAAPLVHDPERWARYVKDSLIETTLSRDVLLLTRVDKPALLRRLFELGCRYSGQILSYTKMLGQLQDAGNTTTLAHYLELLSGAGMLVGLPKYAGTATRQRGSSPKLQVLNNALMNAQGERTLEEARDDASAWGRVVESAVGAHLANAAAMRDCELFYWREGAREVDFVVKSGRRVLAIEVKSGARRDSLAGLGAFLREFPKARPLVVGTGGVEIEDFLARPVAEWIAS